MGKPGDDEARRVVMERAGAEVVDGRWWGRCELCHRRNPLEWCHVLTRGYPSIRHEPDNAFAGCRECHRWFDSHRKEGRLWWMDVIGTARWLRIRRARARA